MNYECVPLLKALYAISQSYDKSNKYHLRKFASYYFLSLLLSIFFLLFVIFF